MSKQCSVGGQAIIEGIMMRNKNKVSIVIRRKNGELIVENKTIEAPKSKISKLPLIRGLFALFSSMSIGVRALTLSAKYFEEDEGVVTEEDKFDKFVRKIFGSKADDAIVLISIITALGLAILLFTVLPTFIISLFRNVVSSQYILSTFEGILKVIFFLVYILMISKMNDVKRVFQYHGAEHKTIHCIESEKELTVENAREFTTLHPRCGTSFLIFVLIISITIFSFITWNNILLRIGLKILLLPLIAGVSYEVLKFSGTSDNKLVKALSKPGLMMQKITTQEPDDQMLEVAIVAVKAVMDDGEC
ncbi:MAG: DUF1385 domain-containing protein [Clostridiales bacterium]|nr:DUF1385 domain-containing protein [Clostridiales bacterium]